MNILLFDLLVSSLAKKELSAHAVPNKDLTLLPPYNETIVKGGWTLYKQCDSRWGGHELGTCKLTVCQAGCAMSSVAMMLATKGVAITPGTLNTWLKDHGGYVDGCDIVWARADAFGKTTFVGIEKAGEAAICDGLKAGHGIIANVNGGSHWVLLTGCAGGNTFWVNDPGFSRSTYTLAEIVQEAVYH